MQGLGLQNQLIEQGDTRSSTLDFPSPPDEKVNFQFPLNCVIPSHIENSLAAKASNLGKSHPLKKEIKNEGNVSIFF